MSTPKTGNDPAFPFQYEVPKGARVIVNGAPQFKAEEPHTYIFHGITMRDYFAAAALQGVLIGGPSHHADYPVLPNEMADKTARACYLIADAMLKAREVQS